MSVKIEIDEEITKVQKALQANQKLFMSLQQKLEECREAIIGHQTLLKFLVDKKTKKVEKIEKK